MTKSALHGNFRSTMPCTSTFAYEQIEHLSIYLYSSVKAKGVSSHVSLRKEHNKRLGRNLLSASHNTGSWTGNAQRLSSCVEVSRSQRRLQGKRSESQYSPQRPENDDSRRLDTNSIRIRWLDCIYSGKRRRRRDDGRPCASAGRSEPCDVGPAGQRDRRNGAAQS